MIQCLGLSLQSSDGWTFREIEKFIQSILSLILSTEKCILTTNIWLTQLKYKKESYHQKNPPQGTPLNDTNQDLQKEPQEEKY